MKLLHAIIIGLGLGGIILLVHNDKPAQPDIGAVMKTESERMAKMQRETEAIRKEIADQMKTNEVITNQNRQP